MKKILVVDVPDGQQVTDVIYTTGDEHEQWEYFLEFQELRPLSNLKEIIKTLEKFNLWRRDDEGKHPMPDPTAIGIALDKAIETLKQLEP